MTISRSIWPGRGTDASCWAQRRGTGGRALKNEMLDQPMLVQLALKLLSEGEKAAETRPARIVS